MGLANCGAAIRASNAEKLTSECEPIGWLALRVYLFVALDDE